VSTQVLPALGIVSYGAAHTLALLGQRGVCAACLGLDWRGSWRNTSLLTIFLCLSRIAIPISWNTYRMFQASNRGAWQRNLFIAQCGTIVLGVLVGAVVVSQFFRGIVRRAGKDAGSSGRRAALRVWMGANNMSLRLVKLLAVFEPAVLRVIDSRMCGRSLTSIPVSSFYAGWRWMWIGDGVVTLIMDCGQLAIGLLQSHLEAEPAGTLNVVVSNVDGACVCRGGGWVPDSSLVVTTCSPHALLRGFRFCLVSSTVRLSQ
jgi:hypothetical protein